MATFTSGDDSFTANVVDLVIGNVSWSVHPYLIGAVGCYIDTVIKYMCLSGQLLHRLII